MADRSKIIPELLSRLTKAAASGVSMAQLRAMVRRDSAQNPEEARYSYTGPYLTKIDNLSEALEFYATNKSPNTVVDAGPTVLRQIEEEVLKSSAWRDLIGGINGELTYLSQSQGQFSEKYKTMTVNIGYFTHIGEVTLEYESITDWKATDLTYDTEPRGTRGISAHTIVYFSFNDEFKFGLHPEHSRTWNLFHETFPGEIARLSTYRPHITKPSTIGGTRFFTRGEFKLEFSSSVIQPGQ